MAKHHHPYPGASCHACQTQAIHYVRELRAAVVSELEAAGPDEVRQHPILIAKNRLVMRAARFLERAEAHHG